MARLKSRKRARLPDRAFAYVDAGGRRRLPIHDRAHVRNALARFNQVAFESEAAREQARRRLLNAARKYRIVPVGFITGQLHAERDRPRGRGRRGAAALPRGFVTFLMSDIEDSTVLLRELGDRYGRLLSKVRGILRGAVTRAGGSEIDARGDELFAVFERAPAAIETAVAAQRALADRTSTAGHPVRVRVGIHSGRPTLTDAGYIGLPVHATARVCSAAHGGQILVSGATRAAIGTAAPTGVRFRSRGRHRLPGLPDPETLFQVQARGLRADFPPPRIQRRAGRRAAADGAAAGAPTRPAAGQLELPQPPA
jgi:class 3 adenylate cyclase